jgi:hypothetical protein
MAKRCLEEFNPWPPFVDIFSSTILVLLLFMLILIVNLGYYAQFKFKISYTGSVATDQVIQESVTTINKVDKITENKPIEQQEVKQQEIKKTSIVNEEIVEEQEMEKAGQDMTQVDDTQTTDQQILQEDKYMILTFVDEEILLDDVTINQVKQFLQTAQQNYPGHKIIVSATSPTNQVSATIAKQIALARSLNVRNLVRKQKYNKSDVRIRTITPELEEKIPPNEAGVITLWVEVN